MLLPPGIVTEDSWVATERRCWERLPANLTSTAGSPSRTALVGLAPMESDHYKRPRWLQTPSPPSHKPQLASSILPIAITTFVHPSTAEKPCSPSQKHRNDGHRHPPPRQTYRRHAQRPSQTTVLHPQLSAANPTPTSSYHHPQPRSSG
jgi:hypothetical protein